jgi:PAS domain S-box-containing protein
MRDKRKTKAQLVQELAAMRQQISELETLTTEYQRLDTEQTHRLTREQAQRSWAEKLHEVSKILNGSLNYETVLDHILEQMAHLIPYDAACVMLVSQNTVRVFRWEGYARRGVEHSFALRRFKVAETPLLRTMQTTGRPMLISFVEGYDAWIHSYGKSWVKSHLGMPICIRDEIAGFLILDSATPGFFNQAHVELLQRFTAHVAVALGNAQMYDQARQEVAQRVKTVKRERNFVSAILNTTSALVMVLNSHGRILRLNRAYEQTTGYTLEEVRGKYFWEIFVPADEASKVRAAFQELQTGQRSREFESYWLTKTRKRRLICWSNSVLQDHDGDIEYIISTGIDLTEQRQLRERLLAIHQLGRELNLLRDEVEICKIALETASFLLQIKSSGYGVIDPITGRLNYSYYPVRGVPHQVDLCLPLDREERIKLLVEQQVTPGPKAIAERLVAPSLHHFWLTAFMQVRDRTIGVLDVESHDPYQFSARDQQLLQTLADQTAVAIENARLHQETQKRVDEVTALSEISQAITSTLKLEDTLTLITNHTIRLMNAMAASVALCDENKGDLWFHAASGGVSDFVRGLRLPAGQGIVGWVIQHGLPVLAPDVSQDARFFNKLDEMSGFTTRSVICVPLKSGQQVTGAIEVMNKKEGSFTEEDLRLLTSLATPASIAIENARLFRQVRMSHTQLQSLSRRLVEVQETERRHIARELHDEAGQALTSLMVGLRLLEGETRDPEAISTKIVELKHIANDVSENLHRLAMDLRPSSLDYLGLVAALRQYIESFGQQHNLAMHFEAVGFDEKRLPPAIETNLYRITQEALTNVARHAQASRVDIFLERRPDQVVIIVEDNGVGFDPEMVKQQSRLGLLGMRERTEMLNGLLVIESTIGTGTTIYVEVPYEHSHSHR